MVRYRQSRRLATEERNSIRTALIYIGLTIAAIILIFFFGIPIIGRFAGFLHDLGSSNTPVDVNDTTPPAPPVFDTLPKVTNKTALDVTGRTEAGVSVKITANGNESEVVANNEGFFNFKWELQKGDNTISAISKDPAGNESQESEKSSVRYDDIKPDLVITSPTDNASFAGSKERQIAIEGTTEEGASVTVNDRIVAVDSAGSFTFYSSLTDGDNSFTVVSKDAAGNETAQHLTVHFTP